MSLPTPAEVARLMPAIVAEAGGSLDYQDLRDAIDRKYIEMVGGERGEPKEFLRQLFSEALGIAVNGKLLNTSGTRLALTDRGWMHAGTDPIARAGLRREPGLARRRPGRRSGATWPTLVCEVIQELGGHADWQSIAEALAKLPEAQESVSWREEAMQALRNNAGGRGRDYFEAAEVAGRAVYSLTDNGRKLVKRRSVDARAPTLSKQLAEAVSTEDDGLTDIEIFTLLFLATRLGRVQDARRLYDRLPADFPDEDSYAMIPIWIDQAERTAASTA